MNLKVNDMETGKIIYVDGNNEYLKGLIKILRKFVVEEVCNASFSEIRLNNKIDSLRQLYGKVRRMLSENPHRAQVRQRPWRIRDTVYKMQRHKV